MATTQQSESIQETAPRTRERGHLSLVEWPTDPPAMPSQKPSATVRRASADRLYEGGILLLMAAAALAALVSFARL